MNLFFTEFPNNSLSGPCKSSRLATHAAENDITQACRDSTDGCTGSAEEPEVPKPKRPRTAYNLYFRDQQEKMHKARLSSGKKCSSNMPAVISQGWKSISPSLRMHYHQLAAEDKIRYYNEKIRYQDYLESQSKADVQKYRAKEPSSSQGRKEIQKENLSPHISDFAISELYNSLDPDSIDFLIKALI